jgi:hypothetical protein
MSNNCPGISFFCAPKPFAGHIAIIQENAIKSWSLLPQCEVILCGNEAGTEDMAKRVGARWIRSIDRSTLGTPMLDSVFREVAAIACCPLLCYVNADIIFTKSLLTAVAKFRRQDFLGVGRRWNVEITELIDFNEPTWGQSLHQYARKRGSLFIPSAMDYFLFPKTSGLQDMPPFIIGRPGWDNWFIYMARKRRIQVCDMTNAAMAIHQDHDYAHVPKRVGARWDGPEADWNYNLLEFKDYFFTVEDATHVMTTIGPMPALGMRYCKKRLKSWPKLNPSVKSFGRPIRKCVKALVSAINIRIS